MSQPTKAQEAADALNRETIAELERQLASALKGKRPYSSAFADETIAAQVKRIAELEKKLNGWFSERGALRADVAELEKAEADRKALLLLCGAESTVKGARCWMESETQLRDRIEKELRERLAAFDAPWDDSPLWPEDMKIDAAHPCESGDHKTYMEAMRLVGACRSKSRLVNLVNWLLQAPKPDKL